MYSTKNNIIYFYSRSSNLIPVVGFSDWSPGIVFAIFPTKAHGYKDASILLACTASNFC